MRAVRSLSLCMLLGLVAACSAPQMQPANDTLYDQLGGKAGLELLVDEFIYRLARDEQVSHYFANSSVSHFRQGSLQHLCDISGGPCDYQGDSMRQIHTGMNIDEADFNRVVELLIQSMEALSIPYPTQNRLLGRLARLREDVIHM